MECTFLRDKEQQAQMQSLFALWKDNRSELKDSMFITLCKLVSWLPYPLQAGSKLQSSQTARYRARCYELLDSFAETMYQSTRLLSPSSCPSPANPLVSSRCKECILFYDMEWFAVTSQTSIYDVWQFSQHATRQSMTYYRHCDEGPRVEFTRTIYRTTSPCHNETSKLTQPQLQQPKIGNELLQDELLQVLLRHGHHCAEWQPKTGALKWCNQEKCEKIVIHKQS